MKKIFTFSLLLAITALSNAQVNFGHSYKESKNLKSKAKYYFIDFTAVWCGPCKQMDKKVFTDKKIANILNTKFIPIKIDIDTPEGRELVEKYTIEGVPAIVIIDKNEKIIKRMDGYFPADKLLIELESIN